MRALWNGFNPRLRRKEGFVVVAGLACSGVTRPGMPGG